MFYFDYIHGKKILKSSLISSTQAFFTTREICIKSDEPALCASIIENKKLICDYLNINQNNFISPQQTHTNNIAVATQNKTYPQTDSLILTDKNLGVFLNFADCTPIILFDENQNIGAVCHAGWRGTASKISFLTAQKLINEFNSNPANITALIGPAIGLCCYNIGKDVFNKLSPSVESFQDLYQIKNDSIFVDLKNINKRQLQESGIVKIDVCPYCTVCNNDYFFSFRKENKTTSRHSAVLRLKN